MLKAEAATPKRPPYWRGSLTQDVETLDDLRRYISMMLEITDVPGARSGVLIEAFSNADTWFFRSGLTQQPPPFPDPTTDHQARKALMEMRRWIDSGDGPTATKSTGASDEVDRSEPPVVVQHADGPEPSPRQDAPAAVIETAPAPPTTVEIKLRWDDARRELWLGDTFVTRYRQPAQNQMAIIAAFVTAQWPTKIECPHAFRGAKAASTLNDTIYELNTRQSIIRFYGNGTANDIVWEVRQSSDKAPA